MYIGKTIDVIGDLCLEGNTRPAPDLITISNLPNYKQNNPSTITVAPSTLAFNCIGLGNTDSTKSHRINVYLHGLEITGTKASSIFLDTTAFGAPSRPSKIDLCYIHDIDTFFKAHQDTSATTSTLIYNLDVRNNYISAVTNVFDVTTTGSNKVSLGGLSICDNTIEGCANITLDRIFGGIVIQNNLMEGLTGTFFIRLARGSLDMSCNYFETNNGYFKIYGNAVALARLYFKGMYILHSPNLNMEIQNMQVRGDITDMSGHLDFNTVDFSEVDILRRATPNVINAQTSQFRVAQLPAITNVTPTYTWATHDDTFLNYDMKTLSSAVTAGYSTAMKITQGKLYAVVYTTPDTGTDLAVSYIASNGTDGHGLTGQTVVYKKGLNVLLFRALDTTTSGGLRLTPLNSSSVRISDIMFLELEDNTPLYEQLRTVTPDCNSLFL